MFTYEIITSPDSFSLKEANILSIFESVAREVPIAQKGIINIAFLSDEEIQKLNNLYRGIDATTDVLSFHYFEDFSDVREDEIAGEIILSESKVISQALEHGHLPESEAEILILHGAIHILGFDHETDEEYEEMWKYEKNLRNGILSKIH